MLDWKAIVYDVLTSLLNATILWVFSNYLLIYLEHRLPTLTWIECLVASIFVNTLTCCKFEKQKK